MGNKKAVIIQILFFLFSSHASCQNQHKVIETDQDVVFLLEGVILPDYSYKGYEVQPFADGDYIMPFEIGDERLVLYYKGQQGDLFGRQGTFTLEKHIIADTVSSFKVIQGKKRYITMPIFDDGSIHNNSPEYMMLFKGFKTYNTHLPEDIENSVSYDEMQGMKEGSGYLKTYHSWKRGDKEYSLNECSYEKDDIHEISFTDGTIEQVLVRKYPCNGEFYNFFQIRSGVDLDGDGLSDIVISISNTTEVEIGKITETTYYSSYLLFLSSEAEEGQLLKHVATKTIVSDNNTMIPEYNLQAVEMGEEL